MRQIGWILGKNKAMLQYKQSSDFLKCVLVDLACDADPPSCCAAEGFGLSVCGYRRECMGDI